MGRSRTAATAMLAFLIAACAPEPEPDDSATAPPMPADFAISVGAGGGFAGTWSQTSVAANGEVRTTSDESVGEGSTPTGRLSDDARGQIWRELHARGFFAMPNEPGNMSTVITVTAEGDTTSAACEMGAGSAEFEALLRFVTGQIAAADPVDSGDQRR